MLKLEHTNVSGWEAAIRGMRNPMNSWDKSDTVFFDEDGDYYTLSGDTGLLPICLNGAPNDFIFGEADLTLMKKLASQGPVHGKFRRMITVTVDITAPLYWWKEFDTYKVGTVANSCSTMHKIHEKEFTLDDFSHEHLEDNMSIPYASNILFKPDFKTALIATINMLNVARKLYLESKDKRYWWQMIQLLPSSYNQKRTIQLNYEVLASIYQYRRNHKLDEWHTLCDWIEGLPYSEIIVCSVPEPETVETKEGEWIDKGWSGDYNWQIDGRGSCWRLFECSACHKEMQSCTYHYCPNCGAKMKPFKEGGEK